MDACIVTGASSGIGKAISERLLKRGMKVYGISREPEKEKPIHRHFVPVPLDLSDMHSIRGVIRGIAASERSIKILVNNAGVGAFGPHDSIDPDDMERMVRVNLLAPAVLTRLLLGRLRAKRGHVIFIASVAANCPSPMGALYGATKAGLRHFAHSIFEENRRAGLKVHTIMPDITATGFFTDLPFGPALDDAMAYLVPDDVADAVEYVLDSRDPVVIQEIQLRPQVFKIERR